MIPYKEHPKKIEDIKYAPIKYCRLNRCGFAGQQVFYASPDIITICYENNLKVGETFVIGEFNFAPKGLYETRMYYNHQYYSSLNKDFEDELLKI